ncbi:hypothetical protein TrST_g8193 [Triparma strigata]|uniref:Uncharacterized protein n=1 Tax=Triparma strigata TaxID=1606541 RepID=A0A9W7BVC7_9STRA|nr:hypothetical protein TrST_g8193 [Triparma strigata]
MTRSHCLLVLLVSVPSVFCYSVLTTASSSFTGYSLPSLLTIDPPAYTNVDVNTPILFTNKNNILTNTVIDNTPNAKAQPLQALPNKIIVHRYDAPRYSLPNAIVLDGEGPWNVHGDAYEAEDKTDVKIIYTPGSTLGSLSVLHSNCLFSGNAVPMTRRLDCSGVLSDFEDFNRGLESIEKLKGERIDRVETGKEGGCDVVDENWWNEKEGLLRRFLN